MKAYTKLLVPMAVLAISAGTAAAQGLGPDDAAARMKLPAGFDVRVVAAEPLVRQPVAIEFDDRGRLRVIQYLQYPNPAGLKRVQVDRFSRTTYDRVPEPPPKGPRGADQITILEDTDGDGRMDRGRDFVDGLNLTTGLAFGHGRGQGTGAALGHQDHDEVHTYRAEGSGPSRCRVACPKAGQGTVHQSVQ